MIGALVVLVIARLAIHALFLPVFEGPDEPFHLGRVAAFGEQSFTRAFRGGPLSPTIVAGIESHPCGPDLRRAFSCPPFDGHGGAFNVLRATTARPSAKSVDNYENHQPPLYYTLAGSLLSLAHLASGRSVSSVEGDLLFLRLISVALVALTLFGPGRFIAAGWSDGARVSVLLVLLLPGASEALARSSNDGALFLWCAALVASLAKGASPGPLLALFAIGPLIKMTAVPVVVMGVLALWTARRRRVAALATLAALVVVPVQLLRGWQWGGTYELNVTLPQVGDSLASSSVGLLRSLYTFVKTVFWVGGWSFLRAPRPLVVGFLLLIAAAASLARPRRGREFLPHLVGVAAALGGIVLLALMNRRLFGTWGGLGGWYFWGWFPWLSFACVELFRTKRNVGLGLLLGVAGFVLLANAFSLATAIRVYGL